MTKGLFLDDERSPTDVSWLKYPPNTEWQIVRDYDSFVKEMTKPWDLISFDHDIQCWHSGEEYTGYDCLKALIGYAIDNLSYQIPECIFHTANPVGRENMKSFHQTYLRVFGENDE